MTTETTIKTVADLVAELLKFDQTLTCLLCNTERDDDDGENNVALPEISGVYPDLVKSKEGIIKALLIGFSQI